MISESKATRLAASIQEAIERTPLEPGTALGTKSDLVTQHRVALGTLNEALRLLQHRGYVQVRPGPGGGVFVAEAVDRLRMSSTLLAVQDDPQQVGHWFQVQDALEEHVVVGAAAHCRAEDVVRISHALGRLREATGSPEIMNAIWDIDRQIALASPNKVLAQVYCTALDNIVALVKRWPIENRAEQTMARIHEDLALAVIRNDIPGARRAAKEHSPIDYAEIAVEQLAERSTPAGERG